MLLPPAGLLNPPHPILPKSAPWPADNPASNTNGFSSSDFATEASNYTIGSLGSEETAPSPAAYWRFDEGQGTTARDSTTNANDASFSGSPTWQTEDQCVAHKCLYFPGGTSGSLAVAKTVPGVQTVSFWVRPASSSAALIDLNGTARITASNGAISASGFTSPTIYVNGLPSSTLTANVWQMVTVTTGTAVTASAIKIGNYQGDFLKGFMDEVKLYPYARSAAQVKADYAAGSAGAGIVKGVSASFGGSSDKWVTDGLVGYWKMDETATPSTDSSGNGNSGTWTGGAKNYSGKFGSSISLSASGDYVSLGNAASLQITGSLTLSVWASPSANMGIASKALMVKNNSYRMVTDSSGFPLCQIHNGTSWQTAAISSVALTKGAWQQITCIYDQQNIRVFVNGDPKGTSAVTTAIGSNTNALRIGSDEAGTYTDFYQGGLDEVRVYNRALSPAEVRQLHEWAPGPITYYKMDENTGTTTIYDSSGNGYNGTMKNFSQSDWKQGKYGSALYFDGVNNCVDIYSAGFASQFSKDIGTVAVWVRIPDSAAWASATIGEMVILEADTNNQIVVRKQTTNQIRLSYQANGTNEDYYLDTTSLDWMHLAMTWNKPADEVKFYVNGVLTKTNNTLGNWVGALSPTNTVIGARDNACGASYIGKEYVDDARIYNYPRTARQIVEDMNGGRPAQADPVIYYHFEENQNTYRADGSLYVFDSSPNKNDGVLGGAYQTWRQDGKLGKAISAQNDQFLMSAGDLALFDGLTGMTISFWLNPASLATAKDITSKWAGSQANFNIQTDGTNADELDIQIPTTTSDYTSYYATSNLNLTTGVWQYITIVYDGSQAVSANRVKVYKNGQLVSGAVASGTLPSSMTTSTTSDFAIGSGANGSALLASYDEFKVYTCALSQDEISKEYNTGGKALTLGAFGTSPSDGKTASNSASALFCVPGDTSTCQSPIHYWDMEKKSAYNGIGVANQLILDAGSSPLSGRLGSTMNVDSGDPVWTQGKIGSALSFDGVNDLVYFSSPNLGTLNAFTVSAWIKRRSPNSYVTLGAQGGDNSLTMEALDTGVIGSSVGNGSSSGFGSFSSNDTNWHFVEFVFDGSQTGNANRLKGYLDGVQQTLDFGGTTIPSTSVPPVAGFDIGTPYGQAEYTDGQIDEVKICDYARTPAQIAWDYNRGKPVAHWKFNECQGTTIHDSSDNHLHGTLTLGSSGQTSAGTCTANANTAWYNGRNGRFNSSVNFDGIDDYIQVNNPSMPTGDFTLAGWFYQDTVSDPNVLFRIGNGSGEDELRFGVTNGPPVTLRARIDGATCGNTNGTTVLSPQTWYHGVITRSGSNITLYLNGKIDATNTCSSALNFSTCSLLIGADATGSACQDGLESYFIGKLDDLRIYNYALTATQVKMLYNEGSAVRFGPATGAP